MHPPHTKNVAQWKINYSSADGDHLSFFVTKSEFSERFKLCPKVFLYFFTCTNSFNCCAACSSLRPTMCRRHSSRSFSTPSKNQMKRQLRRASCHNRLRIRHMILEQHRWCSTLLCNVAAAIIFQFWWKAQEKNTHNILVIVHSQTQFHLSVGNPQETASACQG